MDVGAGYTTTLRATIPKFVKCEGCGCEFVYLKTATAQGNGFSVLNLSPNSTQYAAGYRASVKLNKLLAECEAVPCPDCGIYQPDMVQLLKKWKWRTLRTLGLCTTICQVAVVAPLVALNAGQPIRGYLSAFAPPGAYAALAGLALLAFGWTLRARYDPNADAAQRAGQVPVTPQGPFRPDEYEQLVRAAKEG